MKISRIRSIGYIVCMGAAALILLAILLGAFFSSGSARYVSVHPASTMQPLIGFSPDALVNTGGAEALDTLPGVGEVIAQRIIETRELLCGYRLPEDLLLVKGIGEKTLDKIMEALDEPLVILPELYE